MMRPPYCSFHFQTSSTKASRPKSCLLTPDSFISLRSTTLYGRLRCQQQQQQQAVRLLFSLLLYLRGNAGVVQAGQPHDVKAAHAVPARQRVLDRDRERVADVQRARDIGRRKHHVERLAALAWLVDHALPVGLPAGLHHRRVVRAGQRRIAHTLTQILRQQNQRLLLLLSERSHGLQPVGRQRPGWPDVCQPQHGDHQEMRHTLRLWIDLLIFNQSNYVLAFILTNEKTQMNMWASPHECRPAQNTMMAIKRSMRALGRAAYSSAAAEPHVARSLRDVARDGKAVQELLLPKSDDLVCRNIMCEFVGSSCACRLALVLERVPQLERMDLSNNQLRLLPDPVFALTKLTHLDLSQNALTTISERIQELSALEVLDLRQNQLTQLPEQALDALPQLREIRVSGNPLQTPPESHALRAKIVHE